MKAVLKRCFSILSFLAILVFLGCGPREIRRLPRDASLRESDGSLEMQESEEVRGLDAGASERADAEVDVARLNGQDASFLFLSRLLSPTTCHGRTLNLPAEMHASGLQAFHLCYVTPDSHTRTDGGFVNARPSSVDFQVGSDTSASLFSGVTAEAPRVADPWTASVAIAISSSVTVPRFNVRHVFSSTPTQAVWALDGDGRGGVIARGTLRLWRVASDGSQTEISLQTLFTSCGGRSADTSLPAASYVQEGLCPGMLQMCPAGPYHCRR